MNEEGGGSSENGGTAPDGDPATLSGVIERVITVKPDSGFAVLSIRTHGAERPVTLVGEVLDARPGQVIRAEGAWQTTEAWGRQFRARCISLLAPATEEGLMGFLASGAIRGVGETAARKLVERFGTGLGEIIEQSPARLKEVPGIGGKTADRIVESWQKEKGARDILMFLHTQGVRPARARRILDAYGENAMARLMADPYLLARDVRGIGFVTADELAMRLGVRAEADIRRMAALNEALRLASEGGHTALGMTETVERAAGLIAVEPAAVAATVERAIATGRIVARTVGEQLFLQLPDLARAEEELAGRLAAMAGPAQEMSDCVAIGTVEQRLDLALAPSQKSAVAGVLAACAAIVTGGPGTGKTTLVRAILASIDDDGIRIALCAPTGRAARRMTESTGFPASTIHRLIEADPARGFGRNAERPLETDFVVVDEVSMVDTLLLHGLVDALPEHARLVLVGDVDQLPPVGPGQPLADIIQSGILPVFRLTEIFRQAAQSGIVRGAHEVVAGRLPPLRSEVSPDCFGIRVRDAEDAAQKLIELAGRRIPERFEFDMLDDIQIIAPVNRGAAGTRMLNERLQPALNPDPEAWLEKSGTRFAVGDKVMQIENDNSREVYNGDIGRVVAVDARARLVDVRFDDRTLLYGYEEIDQLQPAFAITVHKAQGSEYPAVLLVLLREHGRMLRRQLLYTAMTRAERLLVILTQGDAFERAVRDVLPTRSSLLKHLLIEKGVS
ncbi:MAG: ATP-dependent RecD-like DNA helicase [Geminicoccaceae bacterium]